MHRTYTEDCRERELLEPAPFAVGVATCWWLATGGARGAGACAWVLLVVAATGGALVEMVGLWLLVVGAVCWGTLCPLPPLDAPLRRIWGDGSGLARGLGEVASALGRPAGWCCWCWWCG